jgi:hypothetical protein
VSLKRWLDLVAPGQASGEGRLAGRLPLRVALEPKLRVGFGEGFLLAEPGGWFRINDVDTLKTMLDEHMPKVQGETDYSEVVKDRMVRALRDFGYSTLKFEILRNGRDQTLRVTTIGKGRKVPQEMNLTVNFNGFDDAIHSALALKLGLDKLLGGDR